MAYYSSLSYIFNYLYSMLGIDFILVIKASISLLIIGGYIGLIIRGVLKVLRVLRTSEGLLV
jgi:hypothetical protein